MPSHEIKHLFPRALNPTILQWLHLRCPPDPQYPDAIVSSIYYDSPDNYCLDAKLNSDFLKTKIRWRWYSHPLTGEPGAAAFLEVKSKIGATRTKLRIPTQRNGPWLDQASLTDHNLLEANELLLRHGILPPRAWYPAFQITYRRRRFMEPCTGGRLCVDTDITVPRAHPRLGPYQMPLAIDLSVLEFKTHLDELPPQLHQLTAMGCRREAFSKFLTCYNQLREFTQPKVL